MPSLGFQRRFVPLIRQGKKKQTLRAYRRDRRDPRPGQTLFLFSGMRTIHCFLIRKVLCKSVFPVEIRYHEGVRVAHGSPCKVERLARLDGFKNGAELFEFLEKTHGLPFRGLLIRW